MMWKMLSLATFIVSSLVVWAGPAQAQYFGRGLDGREAVQDHRIHQGMASGAITPREAGQLAAQQRHIQMAEARMRSDGRLNYQERARLDRMYDKADRNIYRQSHDRQTAYSGHRNHYRQQHQGPHYAPRHNRHHQQAAYRHHQGRPNQCSRPAPGRFAWYR